MLRLVPFIAYAMVYVETSLYLTTDFDCFVKYENSNFSFHFMWHSQGKRTCKA